MSAKFEKGDNVVVISTNKIGTVNQVLSRNNNYGYKVTIDGKQTTYQEKFLKKYSNEEDEIKESWVFNEFGDTNDFKIFQTWYRLKRPIEGDLYSYLASKTVFNQFQFKPLLKFISSGSDERLFIADEVGVGKTIETGIILTELLARGRITRKSPILIVCPNSIGIKWREEMKDRFGFSFYFHTAESLKNYLQSAKNGIIPNEYKWSIVSLQTLRHKNYITVLEEVKSDRINDIFSMVIIDEAHHMRNNNTITNRLGNLLSSMTEMMLMLSATPLNLKDEDLYNQMHILNPGLFADKQTFQTLLSPVKSINKCRRYLESKNIDYYEEIIHELESLRSDPLGEIIYDNPSIKNLIQVLYEKQKLSDSKIAEYSNLLMSFSPFDQSFTRTLKREAFQNRVIREPIKVCVDLSKKERDFYNEVIKVVEEIYILKKGNSKALGFITNTPRRMASSCIPAMKDYLKWCLDNNKMLDINQDNDEEIEDESDLVQIELPKEIKDKFEYLLDKASEIEENDYKYNEFIKIIKQIMNITDNKQIIVFSFFVRTLKYLKKRLINDGYRVGLICGEMPLETEKGKIGRYEVMKQFKNGEYDILLASDVGGEGLDFQFCQAMINYDLPYNPMKIEQRIGRIDRFGQKASKIFVASMYLKDTVDEAIYTALYERIKLVEDSVGLMEPIVEEKITELQSDIITNKLSPEQLKRKIEDINLAIQEAKLELEKFENNREELLGDEYFKKTIANMDKTDFVGPSDAIFLTKMFLENYDDCVFHIDGEIARMKLSKIIREKISRYIKKPGSEGSSRELQPLLTNKEIKVVFNGSIAIENSDAHFLSPTGFWIRFLLDELENNKKIYRVFYGKSYEKLINIPKGNYIVPFYEVKTEGFRTELNLAAVPININTLKTFECDYTKFCRRISKVIINSEHNDEVDIQPDEYINIGIESVEKSNNDKISILKDENKFKIESKKRSLNEGCRIRCERLSKRIETHIEKNKIEGLEPNKDFIRLINSQIQNEKNNTINKINKLEKKSELSVSNSLIALMYLSVKEGDNING